VGRLDVDGMKQPNQVGEITLLKEDLSSGHSPSIGVKVRQYTVLGWLGPLSGHKLDSLLTRASVDGPAGDIGGGGPGRSGGSCTSLATPLAAAGIGDKLTTVRTGDGIAEARSVKVLLPQVGRIGVDLAIFATLDPLAGSRISFHHSRTVDNLGTGDRVLGWIIPLVHDTLTTLAPLPSGGIDIAVRLGILTGPEAEPGEGF
jgi:hypothetical protein